LLQEATEQDLQSAQMKTQLLFIDDDPLIVESLSLALADEFTVQSAESREMTLDLLRKTGNTPSIALLDLGLPPQPHHPEEGFKLIKELLVFNPNIKILVLSGQSESANIQHALTLGAVDFVPKPCNVPLLRSRIKHQLMMLEAEQSQGIGELSGERFLGESQSVKTLLQIVSQFANTPFPILVEGESGSGKELVAKYLHDQSPRAEAAFLTINCAAFSSELLEAQLFGHAKGAYTGASRDVAGFFGDAGEGSLVLDEIGEMPLGLQSKLLRVLENGEYYRLGETQVRNSKARIIAVTNRDLREEVRTGRFRQDLYHRLSVLTIGVPPLRERGDDSLLLLDHFKTLYALNSKPFELEKKAQERFLNYTFPGNVRELRNICIRLNSKYPGITITAEQLDQELESEISALTSEISDEVSQTVRNEMLNEEFRLEKTLSDWERRYIFVAMEMSGGNLSKAARYLGINRTTLYSRIQRLSINMP
jgi:DNA-binding NtrC family response regulator